MSAQPGPLAAKYKADADKIIAAAMADNDGYAALAYLTDHVGKRLSGSPQLNTAVEWGAELMKKAGLQNVQIQPVMVPHWVRGNESATITYKGRGGHHRKAAAHARPRHERWHTKGRHHRSGCLRA